MGADEAAEREILLNIGAYVSHSPDFNRKE
jgi:hypothetical protein